MKIIVSWTEQARSDLAAIHTFISQDSSNYAAVVIRQLIATVDKIVRSPDRQIARCLALINVTTRLWPPTRS
jgi:hypothetical protein